MSPKKELTEVMPTCGIIMPISAIEDCPQEHWIDVLGIIKDVCKQNNFEPNLVSDADDVGVIQNRIVENIYTSDLVICDVSCKNANVMFELGMRLAFDKPTILIKDDQTGYCFDTGVIEHIEYPRDLRFTTINKFKDHLGKKLVATYEKAQADSNFSTFLKHFGKYKIAHLEDKEITSESYLISAMDEIKRDLRMLKNNSSSLAYIQARNNSGNILTTNGNNQYLTFREKLKDYLYINKIEIDKNNVDEVLPSIISDLSKDLAFRKYAINPDDLENLIKEHVFGIFHKIK